MCQIFVFGLIIKKNLLFLAGFFYGDENSYFLLPSEGLEPSKIALHVPETCVSTNFTTTACYIISFLFFV